MNILALDVGTSAVKAAVLDRDRAAPLAPPARAPYDLDHPSPDAAEIPPQRLRDAVWKAAREAVAGLPPGISVEGVGLSCLMPALVLLDAADRPLAPIWIHLDRRARPIARQILAECGDEFLATCGNRPLPGGMSALCYAQMLRDDTSLRRYTRRYLHANGWLAFLMTGERRFDRGNACFTGLFDTIGTRTWSPRWCERFAVEMSWLPEVVSGDETIGELRPDVATEWGLDPGLPVKIGTADTSSAMLAARMQSGDLLHSVGTTQVLAYLTTQPKPDASRLTRLFGVGDSYVHVTHNPVGGSALSWMHDLCFRDQPPSEFYGKTVLDAAHRVTDVRLDPPFLGGDRLEIEARRACLRELTLATDRMDLLTALLGAMRDGHRSAFTSLGWGDAPIRRIILTGGGWETVRALLPEYSDAHIETIDEGAMRGVASLFATK